MTTVITRFFDSADQARAVRHELYHLRRFSPRIMRVFDTPQGLAEALSAADVDPRAAQAYAARMAGRGGAVLMVRAGHRPLNVAKTTRQTTARMGAVDLGDLPEEVYVPESIGPRLSVLEDQPLMLTRPRDPDSTTFHMADWPWPLILRREKAPDTLVGGNPTLTGAFYPLLMPYVPFTTSIFPRHARMAHFPIPLLSQRKPYTGSIIPPHARMANFPIPLLSRRVPRNRSIIPRHGRMANWPFPLLISDPVGTNALMPGGPRMANWPIRLLSGRKPFTASIFGRHARMASFPIPLISRRQPSTASIFPRHARMADFILPLVIRRSDDPAHGKGRSFSLSRLLGLPTLIQR
ncbi:MAG: PucR family transcriptional regulator [Tabrizicola sp.]|jgi:hypothetical protein|nr:PucR family transcriptional regulator [Tabrizicola sp.]